MTTPYEPAYTELYVTVGPGHTGYVAATEPDARMLRYAIGADNFASYELDDVQCHAHTLGCAIVVVERKEAVA